jgi:hypothetical protein
MKVYAMNQTIREKLESTTIKALFNQNSTFKSQVLACKLIIEEEYVGLQIKQRQNQNHVQEDAYLAR